MDMQDMNEYVNKLYKKKKKKGKRHSALKRKQGKVLTIAATIHCCFSLYYC